MNNDLMRLSDLVPEYARHYNVTPEQAAHGLHELIEELCMEYGKFQGERCLPSGIFWVGRGESPRRSVKFYILGYEELSTYFKSMFDTPLGTNNNVVYCYCAGDVEYRNIPAGVVYLSRTALYEGITNARIEPPAFILKNHVEKQTNPDEAVAEFTTKELNSINKIIKGLVGIIKEVGKAYAEQPLDDVARRRAEAIKRTVSMINNPPRDNFNLPLHLINLADDAGVDMVNSHETLRRYMGFPSRPRKGT